MREKGIIPAYILAIVLLLLIGAGVLAVKALKDASLSLDQRLRNVNEVSAHDYVGRGQRAQALRASVPEHEIELYSKHEATLLILEYADRLNERYGATISAPLVDDGRTLMAPVEFTLRFNRFEPFNVLLDELISGVRPMVYISNLSLELKEEELNAYEMSIAVELSMPYVDVAESVDMMGEGSVADVTEENMINIESGMEGEVANEEQ